MSHFLSGLFIYAHFGNLILELNMVPGVLLEPYMSQGDQCVAETPIVSKGLITQGSISSDDHNEG